LFAWWSIGALVFSAWVILVRALAVVGILALAFWGRLPVLENALVLGAFFIILYAGALRAKTQADNSIRFSALNVFSGSRGAVLFCLSLILTLCFAAPFLSYGSANFSRSMIDWIFPVAERLFQGVYPGVSFEMTINELFDAMMAKQIEQVGSPGNLSIPGLGSSGFNLGPYAEQLFQGLGREARLEFLNRISFLIGFSVKGPETISDVFVKYAETQYLKYNQTTRSLVGKGIFVLLLLGVNGLVQLAGFAFSFFELVMLWFLRAVRLLRIKRVTVEKEILSLG
jgi:hypothetical protein